ncbi:unnamed protein product, partial [Symbiodinium sp. KB8]
MHRLFSLLLALLALFEPTLSNRLARQEETDREAATVPCGCNNKVGVLAPKHALPGISIAADAECSRPKVHKSLTGGKYCSCDEGKARNWKEALGEAQAEVEKVLEPKLDAMKKAVAELEESLGIEIDASSLSKVRFLVRRFPRKAGQGLWACCCQSQAAGKCQKDAEMESRFWRSGFHHEAPLRACDEEDQAATTTAGSTTSEPRTTSADAEPESTTAPSTAPEEPATKQQLPTHLLTAIRDFNKADLQTTQQPESESGVIPPTATGEETVPVRSNRDSRSFLDDIKAQRFALKAVETTTPLSTTGEGLMGALSAGLAKVRKATHGDEEDEDEDDGEFVCGWRQPQGPTGSPPGAVARGARTGEVRGGPDAFSYNLVIKKTCDGSSWQGALCLLKEMDEQQLVVDMLTYHMVMTAQMNGLHWAECLATLQAMEEAQVDDPGILAYGPAVGACLRTLQWEQALLIVQRLRQRRQLPDSPMMNSCITVCERAGQWQLALQIYWDMCLFGPPPDETTCNAALAACARGARWQRALDLLPRSESERPERPEALGCVLEALQLSAKWHQAMELWALQPKPNVICTSSVLLACSRAQRWPQVAALQEDSAGALMEASQDLHRGVLELAHANIVVALLDALEYRDREAAAFRKTLYEPAKRQLVQLSRAAALPELMAGEAVLRCKLLERQSSLGRFFVHRFCSERFGSPSKAVQAKAAKASRRAMAQAGGIWDERPVAKHILAWVECRLPWLSGARLGGHRVDHEIRSRSELLPLHVEHSRAPHAERQ